MFRRLVSLILIPCVLLTQSAAVGHAHTEDSPHGYDARPHFHAPAAPAKHSHDGCIHHHAGESDAEVPEPSSVPDDADIVVLVSLDVAVGRADADSQSPPLPPASLPDAGPLEPRTGSPPLLPVRGAHPPPLRHACPAYVRHLALLI